MRWMLTGMRVRAAWLGASILAACAAPADPRGGAPHAIQQTPETEPPPPAPSRSESFLGVVLASEAVELSAPFEGRLAHMGVQPGDRVKAGTVMGRMALETLRSEDSMAQALLEQAEAEQNRAEVVASGATERLQRYLGSPPGALSTDELSEAKYQEKTALAEVAAARARVRERRASLAGIRQRIREAEIRAPFDCVVAVRYVDAGARVLPGTPVLRIIRAGEFRVRFALPEGRSGAATAGLPVNVFFPALGRSLPGRIESIAPEVDMASRMVFAMAALPTPGEAVRAGMVARVSFSADGQPGKSSGD